MVKRVLSMQDLSCFGKCSLTVAMPILAAMGVECVPLPTSILSTHTGGLGEVVFTDLSDSIPATIQHFERLEICFDVIYIGYLGRKEQIALAKQAVDVLKTDRTIVLLDPVMGDHGALYSRFDTEYVESMKELVKCADYVLPNLTEASLLADVPFVGDLLGQAEIHKLFSQLDALYSTRFVITGITDDNDKIGAASLRQGFLKNMSPHDEDVYYVTKRHRKQLHGTGDIFASVMAGAFAKGECLGEAIARSVDFTAAVIAHSIESGIDERYGVRFEDCLSMLIQ